MLRRYWLWLVLIATPRPAPAQAETVSPWLAGVSDQQKAQAQQQLDAGNALFLDEKYSEALAKYRGALASWDHPAIRFNIVRCLIQLDRIVEATENLTAALKYGPAPLEDDVYADALAYQKLLANQTGDVAAHCTQPDVQVTLDGKAMLTCPGEATLRVLPGTHQLVATKRGFFTQTSEVSVVGGKTESVAVVLDVVTRAKTTTHRYPTWVPWVVFGGGVTVAGIGGVLEVVAASNIRAYDDDVAMSCRSGGCASGTPEYDRLAREQDRAQSFNRIAISVLATGGAAAIVGGVLLYLNRGRDVYADELRPSVQPLPGGGVAVSIGGSL